jgi:hypothetical protein
MSNHVKILKAAALMACVSTLIYLHTAAQEMPEPAGWYTGDMHVHDTCGGTGVTEEQLFGMMDTNNLTFLSVLADIGNGEVNRFPEDLMQVTGEDDSLSTENRIMHWDGEWHFDPVGWFVTEKVIGGHLLTLGLSQADSVTAGYPYPVLTWARDQGAISGFPHFQYLDDSIPQVEMDCCRPLDYPVEVALGTVDFIEEDSTQNHSLVHAYYRLLNCGFRTGLAASTDFPCHDMTPGDLLTYAYIGDEEMTYRNWLDGIAQGRTVISRNGHDEFLDLRVNESAIPGGEIFMADSGNVQVDIRWSSMTELSGTIQVMCNGAVIDSLETTVQPGQPVDFQASYSFAQSGWLAARRMDNSSYKIHTAAVFVMVGGRAIRASADDADFFIRYIDTLIARTSPGGPWNPYFSTSLDSVHERYQSAKELYQQIKNQALGLDTIPVQSEWRKFYQIRETPSVQFVSRHAVEFGIAYKGRYTIQLVNLKGIVVTEKKGTGPETFALPETGLVSGIYSLNLKTEKGSTYTKFFYVQ